MLLVEKNGNDKKKIWLWNEGDSKDGHHSFHSKVGHLSKSNNLLSVCMFCKARANLAFLVLCLKYDKLVDV